MRRVAGWLWPRSQTGRATLVSAVTLLVIVVAVTAIVPAWSWKNVGPIKDLAGAVQSAITVFAIVVGGVFALFKLQLFRTFEPHLTITHEVHHRAISPSYVHIDVTARLHNSSRVKIELREADIWLQLVAPMTDENIEDLYSDVVEEKRLSSIDWPMLDDLQHTWNKGDLIIEPGESHQEAYDFIVSTEIESVNVYTYFYNPVFSDEGRVAEGWRVSTVYDIVKSVR